jgi:L-asparaginase/Glu-tRNA(Gln) amidotransferase subunit D
MPAQLPIIAAGDLAPVKARFLLMLALARQMGPAEIVALFDTASP